MYMYSHELQCSSFVDSTSGQYKHNIWMKAVHYRYTEPLLYNVYYYCKRGACVHKLIQHTHIKVGSVLHLLPCAHAQGVK